MIVSQKLGWAFCVATLLLGCTSSRSKLHFLSAEKLWQQGQFEAAAQEYKSVIELAGNNDLGVHAKERLALTEAYSLNQPQAAKQYFDELLKTQGVSEVQRRSWEEHRAWILVELLQKPDEGFPVLQKLLDTEQSPEADWDLRIRLSHAFVKQGAIDRAYEVVRDEKRPEALVWKLQLLSMRHEIAAGNIELLVTQAVQDLGSNPLSGELAFEYGSLMESLGKLEEAKNWFQRAELTHPHPDLVTRRIERITARMGRKQEKSKGR